MSTTYRIRWKGRTEGPYTRDEILIRLTQGELSVLHRVEIDGTWQPLSQLIKAEATVAKPGATAPPHGHKGAPAPLPCPPEPVPARPAPVSASPLRVRLGYLLSGLTFLFPLVASLPAIAFSGWIRRHGHRDAGNVQLVFIAVFTALGLGFWHLVRQSYLNGHLG